MLKVGQSWAFIFTCFWGKLMFHLEQRCIGVKRVILSPHIGSHKNFLLCLSSYLLVSDSRWKPSFLVLLWRSSFCVKMSIQNTVAKTPIVDKGLDAQTIKKLWVWYFIFTDNSKPNDAKIFKSFSPVSLFDYSYIRPGPPEFTEELRMRQVTMIISHIQR